MPEQKYQRLLQLDQAAPIATQIPHLVTHHSRSLDDHYHWLKDQNYPRVDDKNIIEYLEEENAYYQSFLKPNKSFVEIIFQEFKGRTDEQETSVPYVSNGYEYQWYFRAGEEYRTRTRKNLATGDEAIFMDETALAKGSDYFIIGDWDISPDNRYLAYTFDTDGDERYQLRIKDLETGEYLNDVLNDVQGELEFNTDGTKLMYALLEQGRWYSKNINVHTIGELQKDDITVYTEEDDGFYIGFGKTSSKEFIVIVSAQGEVQETHVLAADFSGKLVTLINRSEDFTQSVDHAHGDFYILANDTHTNFRLATVSDKDPIKENWKTIIDGSDASYLLGLQTFKDFFVLKTRDLGLEKIHVLPYSTSKQLEAHIIEFPEPLFTAGLGVNPEFDQSFIRLSYESMITPGTVFDYNLTKRELNTRKVQKIPSGYDKSQYETKRIMAPARDARETVEICQSRHEGTFIQGV